jgi:hypothetical protein
VGIGEPGCVIRGEADGVVACFVGCEGESAVAGSFSIDDYVGRRHFLDDEIALDYFWVWRK